MKREQRMLSMQDKARIHLTVFSPDGDVCRGAVLFVHGFGEHAGRYEGISSFFVGKGFACYIPDLRGHGLTPGKRGSVSSYGALVRDVSELRKLILAERPGIPLVLYGHSMGGNIALTFLMGGDTEGICCAVISSPWLRLYKPLPRILVGTLGFAALLLPDFAVKSQLTLKMLTHDEAIVEKTAHDPLYHNIMGITLFKGVSAAGENALKNAQKVSLPTLLMAAGDDHIVSAEAISEFAGSAGENVTFHIWPGAYHELHNEPDRAHILEYIWDYILKQSGDF